MSHIPRKQDQAARLRRRRDGDVGEARALADGARPISHLARDRRGGEIEGKDASGVKMFDEVPPRAQVRGLASNSFPCRLCDSLSHLGRRDDGKLDFAGGQVDPIDQSR